MLESGEMLLHEDVVTQLTNDTVSYSNKLGFGGSRFLVNSFAQAVVINLKGEVPSQ